MKRTLSLLLCCLIAATTSAQAKDKDKPKPPKAKPIDVQSFSGEYTFNATCTDEAAIVHVTFRKALEDNNDSWRADGTLDNGHGATIEFTGAYAGIDEDGSVTVDAQFFAFKLTGKELEWLPGYQRPLYKVVNGVLQDQP